MNRIKELMDEPLGRFQWYRKWRGGHWALAALRSNQHDRSWVRGMLWYIVGSAVYYQGRFLTDVDILQEEDW